MRSVKFKSFSSGSCGNCYFLGLEEEGVFTDAVLIDAGVSLRAVKRELQNEKIPLSCIRAILVTHDHMDHIRSLGSYCKYLKLPVWATPELHTAMSYHTYTLEHLAAVRHSLVRECLERNHSRRAGGPLFRRPPRCLPDRGLWDPGGGLAFRHHDRPGTDDAGSPLLCFPCPCRGCGVQL